MGTSCISGGTTGGASAVGPRPLPLPPRVGASRAPRALAARRVS
jgi:hypothetical protein